MAQAPARKAPAPRRAESEVQRRPVEDFVQYCKEYAEERPERCALVCLGIGFVLGWKLKPW